MAAWWAQQLYCDTQGSSGNAGSSVTISIPAQNIFATVSLVQVYINSSGGFGATQINTYQIQEQDGPSGQINVYQPMLWAENVVYGYFGVWGYANPAGFGLVMELMREA